MILVIDSRMLFSSGIGRYIRDILDFVRNDNYFSKIYILVYTDDIKKIKLNNKVIPIIVTSKIFSIKEQLELPFKIPKCDIFWSPQYNIPVFPIRAKKRVVTIHDVYQLAYFDQLSLIKKVYVKIMLNLSVMISDKIITVSSFSKKEILKYTLAKEGKVNVIYNGLSNTFDTKLDKSLTTELYFLYVGNIKPHKNLVRLLDAYKLFLKINSNFKLYIVGQKEGFLTGENNIEKDIQGYEDFITFTGYVSDEKLKEYYSNAELFIFPSLYEGFGYPILEAMVFETKIVASNIASIPEVGGESILYFNPEDTEDICMNIKKAIEKDQVDYSSQLNKFSIENMMINYDKFFKGLENDITNK